MNSIIWYEIAKATYEVNNSTKFFGKTYESNASIKSDIEFILMQRKPGGYRKPTIIDLLGCFPSRDTVLDLFCGTGTTKLAAMKANRHSIGVEIDHEYCQIILKRLQGEGRKLFNQIEINFEKMEELIGVTLGTLHSATSYKLGTVIRHTCE